MVPMCWEKNVTLGDDPPRLRNSSHPCVDDLSQNGYGGGRWWWEGRREGGKEGGKEGGGKEGGKEGRGKNREGRLTKPPSRSTSVSPPSLPPSLSHRSLPFEVGRASRGREGKGRGRNWWAQRNLPIDPSRSLPPPPIPPLSSPPLPSPLGSFRSLQGGLACVLYVSWLFFGLLLGVSGEYMECVSEVSVRCFRGSSGCFHLLPKSSGGVSGVCPGFSVVICVSPGVLCTRQVWDQILDSQQIYPCLFCLRCCFFFLWSLCDY